jgi:hypothetical protein
MTGSDDAGTAGQGATLPELVLRFASAALAGVGVLGFVVLLGGAMDAVTFQAAGLPTDEALAVVPRGTLIALGAQILVPFLGILFVAGVVLFAWESAAGKDRVRHHRFIVTAAVVVAGVAAHTYFADHRPWGSLVFIAALGVALGVLVVWLAGRRTFLVFSLVAATAVGVFAIASGVLQTRLGPLVRPVALVLTDGQVPVVGIFIAATSDRVYVGQVCAKGKDSDEGDKQSGLMLDIAREDIDQMALGRSDRLSRVIAREGPLLRSLLADNDPGVAEAIAPTQDRDLPCTSEGAKALYDEAGPAE